MQKFLPYQFTRTLYHLQAKFLIEFYSLFAEAVPNGLKSAANLPELDLEE